MRFTYKVRDKNGVMQKGEVEASSEEAALQTISQQGLFVTSLKNVDTGPIFSKKITFFDRISNKEIMLFSRQLAVMFRSDVPLIESLEAVAMQSRNTAFRTRIYSISEDVENGTAFSDALAKYPKQFSFFYISMVKRGEALGKLSDVLEYLADHLEREYELRGKLKTAMIYPVFVLFIAASVIVMLMVLVIPNIATILIESGQELPFMTKLVISASDFLKQWGVITGLVLIGMGLAVARFLKTPRGKDIRDKAVLKIPGIKSFLRVVYVARFGENLATLISGGVPLVESLSITSKIVGNSRYQEIIEEAKKEVENGAQISIALKKYPEEFPPIFTQMMAIGERTGNIEKTLDSIVDFYQKEVNRAVDGFLSLIEPLLIVFLGLVVGGLMASVILPMYSITSDF